MNNPVTKPSSDTEAERSGVTLALMAFMIFPVGDAFIKSMSGDWPAPAVASLRFFLGTLIFGLILWRREGLASFHPSQFRAIHIARGFALAVATITFFSAIFIMPLADAAAIQFINPILTVLLGGWFLKERLPMTAWVATLIAFVGVLIMLRPNLAAFGWVALLPLISAVGVSSLIILNRVAGSTGSPNGSMWQAQFQLALWGTLFLTLGATMGHFLVDSLAVTSPPAWHVWLRCMITAMIQSVAHFLLFLATVRATASSIAPITYLQLVMATGISVLVFEDPVDAMTLSGGLLVIVSGLYHWLSSDGRHVVRQWRQQLYKS